MNRVKEKKRRTAKAPVGARAARGGKKWSPGLKHGPTRILSIACDGSRRAGEGVALGLRVEARRKVTRAEANGGFSSDADEKAVRTKAARLMHTAGSLMATAKDFRHGANLWRRGRLE